MAKSRNTKHPPVKNLTDLAVTQESRAYMSLKPGHVNPSKNSKPYESMKGNNAPGSSNEENVYEEIPLEYDNKTYEHEYHEYAEYDASPPYEFAPPPPNVGHNKVVSPPSTYIAPSDNAPDAMHTYLDVVQGDSNYQNIQYNKTTPKKGPHDNESWEYQL